ncbi:YveK family protein [Kribbella swartbergensis]
MTETAEPGTPEFSALARGIKRLWWLIAALGLVGGAAAAMITARMTPMYQGTTSILVGDTLRASQVDTRAIKSAEAVARTYADMIRRRPVMEGVVKTLQLGTSPEELARRVHVERPAGDPQLIEVTVEAASPQQAQAIAGAVANQLLAVSPSRAAGEKRAFVDAQLTGLQAKITATDAYLVSLRKQQAAATTPAARQHLQKRIDLAEKTLATWQRNYADLESLRPPGSASASMEILEKAHASPIPSSPRTQQTVVLAVALGIMVGIPVTYLLERRRAAVPRRRVERPAQAAAGARNETGPRRRKTLAPAWAVPDPTAGRGISGVAGFGWGWSSTERGRGDD